MSWLWLRWTGYQLGQAHVELKAIVGLDLYLWDPFP